MMTLFIFDLSVRQRTLLLEQRERAATGIALTLSTSSAAWLAAYDAAGLQELVETQLRNPDVDFAILTDRDGHIFAHTDKTRKGEYLLDLPGEPGQVIIGNSSDLVDVVAPAILAGQHVGWARVGLNNKTSLRQLATVTLDGTLYALAAILVGAFIAWRMGLRITQRLYVVQTVTSAVQSGDRSARCEVTGTDEAAQLAQAFNLMLDSLAEGDAALSQSEVRYRALFESVGVSLWEEDYSAIQAMLQGLKQQGVADVPGYIREHPEFVSEAARRLQVLEVNDATLKLFHADSKEQLLGSLDQVFVPESFAVFREELVAIAEGRESFESEAINGTLDGKKINILMKVNFPAEFKERGRLTVSIADITELKKVEQELRQKFKMEALGIMAGGMAHNFNNNLSIILGNIELAQIREPQNSQVVPLLENAGTAVFRARDLIQNILAYSRKGTPDKTPIQLSQVVDETIGLLRSTIPTTVNLQLVVDPEIENATIVADSTEIQEALFNLCNNAVYAMGEKGELTVSLKSVDLKKGDIPSSTGLRPGNYVMLSVQDNGCGMTEEIVERIFDPFFTTKTVDQGTGMGLATLQAMVEQRGGLVKVHSAPDKGSTFALYFPLSAKLQTEFSVKNNDLPRGTERILFIDDDEMLASLGKTMLSERGYRVSAMTDSTEALKLFQVNPDSFDLVITDQTMPGITGLVLILELRKIRPDLLTILCTGFSSSVDEDITRELKINAFLMKPLDLPVLLQTVRQVLDKNDQAGTGENPRDVFFAKY
jgi:signal transduction histidine kinase/CheY-like chemotaxis protein/HAMP domain-containing protein